MGKVQYLAVLVFSAYASGLLMVVTNRPVGAEAFLPVGASGRAPCYITNYLYHQLVSRHARVATIVVTRATTKGC